MTGKEWLERFAGLMGAEDPDRRGDRCCYSTWRPRRRIRRSGSPPHRLLHGRARRAEPGGPAGAGAPGRLSGLARQPRVARRSASSRSCGVLTFISRCSTSPKRHSAPSPSSRGESSVTASRAERPAIGRPQAAPVRRARSGRSADASARPRTARRRFRGRRKASPGTRRSGTACRTRPRPRGARRCAERLDHARQRMRRLVGLDPHSTSTSGSSEFAFATITVSIPASAAAANGRSTRGRPPSSAIALRPPRRLPSPPARTATSGLGRPSPWLSGSEVAPSGMLLLREWEWDDTRELDRPGRRRADGARRGRAVAARAGSPRGCGGPGAGERGRGRRARAGGRQLGDGRVCCQGRGHRRSSRTSSRSPGSPEPGGRSRERSGGAARSGSRPGR